MVDYNEIADEIARLERDKTTYSNCEKLSVLYSVIDHREEDQEPRQAKTGLYSYASAPSSEFLQAIRGVNAERIFEILDEHMECVKALYPKEYDMVLRKIIDSK